MQKRLSLATLGELDGGAAGVIIDAAIREAVGDLDDRGEDEKPRKVTIEITLKRMDNGLIESHVEACAKVPRRRTATTVGRVAGNGGKGMGLLFQSQVPDDPDQRTIDELEGK